MWRWGRWGLQPEGAEMKLVRWSGLPEVLPAAMHESHLWRTRVVRIEKGNRRCRGEYAKMFLGPGQVDECGVQKLVPEFALLLCKSQ